MKRMRAIEDTGQFKGETQTGEGKIIETTFKTTRRFNDHCTAESRRLLNRAGLEKEDRYAGSLPDAASEPNRKGQWTLALALWLVTGLDGVNGYAQRVKNLTTPPNVTLTNSKLTVTGDGFPTFTGTITNGGSITLNGGGVLQIGKGGPKLPPTITLTGGGPVTLAGGTILGVQNTAGNYPRLINVNNAISGRGTISTLSSLDNRATINANVASSTLTITDVHITNSGTLQASGGGILTLAGTGVGLSSSVTNTPRAGGQGGSILAGNGSTVNLSKVSVTGGFLDTAGTGVMNATGDVGLSNLTINGSYNVGAGTTTGITGRVRNNGTIAVPRGGTLKGASLINGNKVEAAAGSTVTLSDFNQTGGTTLADGSFQSPRIDVRGGLLTGTGTLTGAVTVAGTFKPGDSGPGVITIVGRYDQMATGRLDEELGGTGVFQFSQTLITGSSSLDGLLKVSLVHGFVPTSSDIFPILEASDGFAGFFSDARPAALGQPGLLHFAGGMFDVNYNVLFDGSPAVTLSNFTPVAAPEPSSLFLLGSGLLGAGTILGPRRLRKLNGDTPRS